jgi:DNA-binding CsgD family transcriptional regulator
MAGGGSSTRLIEREQELAAIDGAVEDGIDGRGSVLYIGGAAGVGKTGLLDAAAAAGRRRGMRVLRGRGVEVERDVAFGVVRQLLERELLRAPADTRDEWTAGAAGLALSVLGDQWPQDGPTAGAGPTYGLLHGIYWLAANIAATRPLLLVVDDAHWADAPSLQALSYLSRRLDGVPAMLIIAARDGADDVAERPLAAIRADASTRTLTPRPLSQAGTGQLVSQLTNGDPSDAAVAACHTASGGNPFLISELVVALCHRAPAAITSEAVAELERTSAGSLSHAVMLRLGGLGPDAVAIAEAVAVLDLDSHVGLVAELAGLDLDRAAVPARRLMAAQLLGDHTPLAFAHPLLRAAVYSDLDAVRRATLHARAARLIADRAAPPERVATHLLLTAPDRDEWVVDTLVAAAEDASAKGADAIAARYLRRALSEPPPQERRGDVLLSLGLAEQAAGEPAAAEPHLREALASDPPAERRAEAGLALSGAVIVNADHAAAIQVLGDVSATLPADLALRLDVERLLLSMWIPDLAAAAKARMREYAALAGATLSERLALAAAALATAFDPAASAGEALETARRALGAGQLLAASSPDTNLYGSAKWVALMCEDVETCAFEAEASLVAARDRGSVYGYAMTEQGLGQIALLRGDFVEAAGHFEAMSDAAEDLPRSQMTRRYLDSGRAYLLTSALVSMGDLERAREEVARGAAAGDLHTAELCLVLYARGLIAFPAGDAASARDDFVAYGKVSEDVGYEERLTPWRQAVALAEYALGNAEAAMEWAERGLAIARAWGAPGGLGRSLRVRALVGAPGEACERLEEAVTVLRGSVARHELATALVDLGVARRRSGARREARDALEEGMDLAARCGANPLVGRAREELHVLGARPRRARISGLDSLTAAERRVASLAADGHTNREIAQALFVTQKTVENHLASAYRKLDIVSRRELPDRLEDSAA